MPQIAYRANLSAALFPMTLARSGRSVIVPGPDQNLNRSVDPPDDSNRDAGIPQIIYGENILPTADGYQSVGYKQVANIGANPAQWKFLTVERDLELAIGSGVIKYCTSAGIWLDTTVTGSPIPATVVGYSAAIVAGEKYICIISSSDVRTVYRYSSPGALIDVTSTFLPAGILDSVVSICGSYNYLILVNLDSTVNWSSTTTPTDFTPSLVSGAGSGRINNIAGIPVKAIANAAGFFVYASANTVCAKYTGNSRYPWRFEPLDGSEGISEVVHVGGKTTDKYNIIAAVSGNLIRVGIDGCNNIAPEVSELISRLKYSDVFNYSTNTFSIIDTSNITVHRMALSYLMDRYVILSLRTSAIEGAFDYAIVYDALLQRYGKFNIKHTSVVDIAALPYLGVGDRTLMFSDGYSGNISLLSQDINDPDVSMRGVLLLGKFQYIRSRLICLDEVSVEAPQLPELISAANRNFSAYAIPTLDGKTFLPAVSLTPHATTSPAAVISYPASIDAKNVSLLFKGAFDICSVDMLFHLGGSL